VGPELGLHWGSVIVLWRIDGDFDF